MSDPSADPRPRSRPELIGDTAIALLAERGLRGLTHRAVDEAAGLPPGSTSNHARTRAALLTTAFQRMVELEAAAFVEALAVEGIPQGPPTLEEFADQVAAMLHHTMTQRRDQTLARFELALEATRRPELRAIYDEGGSAFRDPAVDFLTAFGATDPVRQGLSFIAWCEGTLFDAVAGAGHRATPTRADLSQGLRELLTGFLPRAG